MSAQRDVALGELLLRFKAPGVERFRPPGHLEARFGGAEANVAASWAHEEATASNDRWSACLQGREEFLVSQRYDVTALVDRAGASDAYSAGLLYGLLSNRGARHAFEFATAASCIRLTIPGDVNRVSVNEVDAQKRGQGGGRMQR